MDALLGQLGIGGAQGGDLTRSNSGCNSVDELQRQLHNVVATKKTETRAEHISASFEMRISSVFQIADNIDAAAAEVFEQPRNTTTKTVTASDTLLNQPTDDPKLQKSVAKHLVEALQVVDGSRWDLRQANGPAQGWTFIYQCEHSLQAWNRRNANNSGRPPIGAFSGVGGFDHVNLSRPAFDCRGTLTIIFSKSTRAIVVKYEHTPLHKTVAELVDRLLPTLAPPPEARGNTPSLVRSIKAKRPPPAGGQANGRKKQKKKGEDKPAETTETDSGAHSGAHSRADSGVDSRAQPEVQSVAPVVTPTQSQAIPVLQIPPLEAARRKEVAIRLLTSRDIRPDALSAEQMDIFCNQAPHLQALSLDMLAQYGPERLRIIHPEAKDQTGSSSSTPIQQASPINELANDQISAAGTPTTKTTSRKNSGITMAENIEIGDEVVSILNAEAIPGTPLSQPFRKKTRGACNTCKLAKRKCTKEHPQCSVCREQDETCIYLAAIPRGRRSEISTLPIQANELDTTSQAVELTSYASPAPEHAMQMDATPSFPNFDDDEFIPDPNILASPIDQPPPPAPQPPQGNHYYHQPNISNVPLPEAFISSSTSKHHNTMMPRQASPSNDRGSVPTRQVAQPSRAIANTAVQRQSAPDWANSPYSPAWVERKSTEVKAVSKQQPSKPPRSRLSGTGSNTQAFGSFQAAAVLTQVSIPASYQSNSASIARSPNQSRTLSPNAQSTATQSHSHAKFGQGRSSQSQAAVTRTSNSPSGIPTTHNPTRRTPFQPQASSFNTTSSSGHDIFPHHSTTNDSHHSQSRSVQPSHVTYAPQPYGQTTTQAMANSYMTLPYDYSCAVASNNSSAQAFNETSGYDSAFENNAQQWAARNRTSTSNPPR